MLLLQSIKETDNINKYMLNDFYNNVRYEIIVDSNNTELTSAFKYEYAFFDNDNGQVVIDFNTIMGVVVSLVGNPNKFVSEIIPKLLIYTKILGMLEASKK